MIMFVFLCSMNIPVQMVSQKSTESLPVLDSIVYHVSHVDELISLGIRNVITYFSEGDCSLDNSFPRQIPVPSFCQTMYSMSCYKTTCTTTACPSPSISSILKSHQT